MTKIRSRDAGAGMQEQGCRSRDAGARMQEQGCRSRNAGAGVKGAWTGLPRKAGGANHSATGGNVQPGSFLSLRHHAEVTVQPGLGREASHLAANEI